MIEARIGELASVPADAVLRPIAADGSPVTRAMRRLEELAGPAVAEHCRRMGTLPVGSAAITPAGELSASYMVHVSVRSPADPVSEATVRRGLLNGLRRLVEWEIDSVAMPPLGTGAGNLDIEDAAEAMLDVLRAHMEVAGHPKRVVLIVDGEYEHQVLRQRLRVPPATAGPGAEPG